MPCAGRKAFGMLNFGCVVPDCVFSSVYCSEWKMGYSESSPVIICSRDTNAKKAKENKRDARPVCQGLQPVQLHVPGVSAERA